MTSWQGDTFVWMTPWDSLRYEHSCRGTGSARVRLVCDVTGSQAQTHAQDRSCVIPIPWMKTDSWRRSNLP